MRDSQSHNLLQGSYRIPCSIYQGGTMSDEKFTADLEKRLEMVHKQRIKALTAHMALVAAHYRRPR